MSEDNQKKNTKTEQAQKPVESSNNQNFIVDNTSKIVTSIKSMNDTTYTKKENK